MRIFSENREGNYVKLLFFVRYSSLDIARERIPKKLGEIERILSCSGLKEREDLFEVDRGSIGCIVFGNIVNEGEYLHFKQKLSYS